MSAHPSTAPILDLTLPRVDVDACRADSPAQDHHVVNDELPTHVDLRADDARGVDLRALTFDADGDGLRVRACAAPEGGMTCPAGQQLSGRSVI